MGFVKYIRVQWDRVLGVVLGLLGALALLLGWLGVSGAIYPAAQLPYIISGGLTALFLLGAGSTLWLSADLRDEWRHLDKLQRRIEEHVTENIQAHVELAVRTALAEAQLPQNGERLATGPVKTSVTAASEG